MDANTSLVVTVFLPLAIALVMFGLGLGLVVDDFRRVVKFPKVTVVGLAIKILIMPLTALAVAYSFALTTPYAIGLVMTASGPVSVMANVFTRMAKGNVALSLTFTAIDNLIGAATLPAFTMIAARLFANREESVAIQLLDSIRIFLLIAIPVGCGMLMRHKLPKASAKLERGLGVFSTMLIVALIAMLVVMERQHLMDTIGTVALPVFLLAFCGLIYGLSLRKALKFSKNDGAAITFALPLQGTTVVASVAVAVFHEFDYVMVPGIYSLFMYPVGFMGVWWLGRIRG